MRRTVDTRWGKPGIDTQLEPEMQALIPRFLGATNIAISAVVLGCGTFGGVGSVAELVGRGLDEDAAFASMDEAVALGINLFDTAHGYALGASEKIIGRWLATQSREVRQSIRIATKVGIVHEQGRRRVDNTPQRIAQQVEISLERLQVDRVDFCLTHMPDPETPIEATLEGFAAVIEANKVGHIGASNMTAAQLREALTASARLGLPRYEWVQNEYNLLNREDEQDVFTVCQEFNLGLTPFAPLAGGKLSGKYAQGATPDPNSRVALWPGDRLPSSAQFAALERLRGAAIQRGVSPGALALAWVMSHPLVVAPLVGPSRTGEHLQLAREALTLKLDPNSRREISGWFNAP